MQVINLLKIYGLVKLTESYTAGENAGTGQREKERERKGERKRAGRRCARNTNVAFFVGKNFKDFGKTLFSKK